jgi:hypothetical protein
VPAGKTPGDVFTPPKADQVPPPVDGGLGVPLPAGKTPGDIFTKK